MPAALFHRGACIATHDIASMAVLPTGIEAMSKVEADLAHLGGQLAACMFSGRRVPDAHAGLCTAH
ncbi:protein of unknown function [Ralstonia solanacearum CFBP2957]|nr:protein of unknown function [Ralstonia solanacearum CFBP2957]